MKISIILLSLLLASCSTVTKRNFQEVNSADLKASQKNGRLLIRVFTIPDTEYTYYIKNPLLEEIIDTQMFSSVEVIQQEDVIPDEKELEFFSSTDEKYEKVFSLLPVVPSGGFDYTLDVIIRFKALDQDPFRFIGSLLTLTIYPNKKTFYYDVYTRLIKSAKQEAHQLKHSEAFEVAQSIIPTGRQHFQVSWEKEPVINLVKVSLLKYREAGILN